MSHFIVDSLWAAWVGVGVAIVVAGDGVARTLPVKHLLASPSSSTKQNKTNHGDE